MRLYSCFMLYRICSVVRREETSPKGDGSIRRYFCGEAAAAEKEAAVAAAADDGEAAAEVGADNGAHRLRFGDAGLSSGSKSRVLLRVAPHAIAGAAEVPGSGGVGRGDGRGGQGKGGERRLKESLTDGLKSRKASRGAPVRRAAAAAAAASAAGTVAQAGAGESRRGGVSSSRQPRRGPLPPPQARIPRERLLLPPLSARALRRASGTPALRSAPLGSRYQLREV